VVGIQREIIATSPQRLRGTEYYFEAWSVESPAALIFSTPPDDMTFTVSYIIQQANVPVDTEIVQSDCTAQILNSTLRRRMGPGTSYEVIGVFGLNEQLTVIG